jgi:hypothetical protein
MVPAREGFQRDGNPLLHRLGKFARWCDQNRLAAVTVLGLSDQVSGDPGAPFGVIGEDKDLRWAGQLIDGDEPEHLPLRFDDKRIPGPKSFATAGIVRVP